MLFQTYDLILLTQKDARLLQKHPSDKVEMGLMRRPPSFVCLLRPNGLYLPERPRVGEPLQYII